VLRRLAVLGQPVAHSRSPAIQNAAFAALGLEDEWSYEAIEVAPTEFSARVGAMAAEGFVGANVTVPHKPAALELADDASQVAIEIGAANTLAFEDGEIRADNTDAEGFLASLPESPRSKRALLLGAGGAARAVLWSLLGEGSLVDIWNRTAERADGLAEDLGGTALSSKGQRLTTDDYDLIVNSTAVGLRGEDPFGELPLDPGSFHRRQLVVDLAYGDSETALLRAARDRGATVVDGLEVLVRQGAASFKIWTGVDPPLDVMRSAANRAR
jgi:shikimate dehydrogenase